MKAYIIIIVILLLMPVSNALNAREDLREQNSEQLLDSNKSILELFKVKQFKGLTLNKFQKLYPGFWLYTMDYDENGRARRFLKAPADFTVKVGKYEFKNVVVVFIDNLAEYVTMSLEKNVKSNKWLKDFINHVVASRNGEIVTQKTNYIEIKMNDADNSIFYCYMPSDYRQFYNDIGIWVK